MLSLLLAGCLLLVTAAFWLLWAWLLRAGLRWAGATEVTLRRTLLAGVVVFFAILTVKLVAVFVLDVERGIHFLIPAAITLLLLPWLTIVLVCRVTAVQAFKGWIVTLLAEVALLGLQLLVIRPFLFEGFHIPTNAMAPTVLGVHHQTVCSECGSPAYYSTGGHPDWMICRDHFHVASATDLTEQDAPEHDGDRILVAKSASPERWDLIAFRFPGDPAKIYLMRVVGLPGEEITIKDGKVWINGAVSSPPDSVREIEYASEMGFGMPIAGSPGNPAQLRTDEFFVLGDFSRKASDSRLWQGGAEGHPPFAVPRSHLVGVVTHIYWPPERWRTFR